MSRNAGFENNGIYPRVNALKWWEKRTIHHARRETIPL
jgi:hypothetical protein